MDWECEVMRRVAEGEKTAFNEILEQYQAPIINFACRMVGNRQLAEEISQETFLRVYLSAGRYRPDAKFSTYLYRIARNLSLNTLRKRKWLGFLGDWGEKVREKAGGLEPGPGAIPEQEEIKNLVTSALQTLPPDQKTALVLCKYDELSYEEIAGVMNLSIPAVKSLIHRAKENLKQKLSSAKLF